MHPNPGSDNRCALMFSFLNQLLVPVSIEYVYSFQKKTATMKKWSTLLLSITIFATAFSQTGAEREEAKRVILGDRKGSTSYPKSGNDRDVISDRDDRTVYGRTSRRYPGQYPTVYGGSREQRMYEINQTYDANIF
jgi:hypothetical protein